MEKRIVLRALICAIVLALCLGATALADVARGSRGDDVAAIQRRLIELGYLNDTADGIFGKKTEAAVSAFQQAEGLPATGVVDDATAGRLNAAYDDAEPAAQADLAAGDAFANLQVVEGCGWVADADSPLYPLGRNAAGQQVIYGISLVNSGAPDRMALESVSWATDFDAECTDMLAAWNDAKAGITSAKVDRHTEISNDGHVYSMAMVHVFLPDDPSIGGEQSVAVSLAGHTAEARLSLTYRGGYEGGDGWGVELLDIVLDGESR